MALGVLQLMFIYCTRCPRSVLRNISLDRIGHLPCSASASILRIDHIGSP